MKYYIHKFGGTCLANPSSVKHSIRILANTIKQLPDMDNRHVIAISAAYGVTDIIRNSCENVLKSPSIIDDTITSLKSKHGLFIVDYPELELVNEKLMKKITDILLEAQVIKNLSDSRKDEILVIGERFMALCFSFYLKNENLTSKVLYPEDLELFTDGQFNNAVVELDNSFDRLISIVHQNNGIIVIPGFYGISYNRVITTFGTSGTDYTATILANILDAEKIIIWKDVNGFMSADPKVVSSAISIDHLEYEEAAELAHFGAKVLHPKAVMPVAIKKIPIEIRNVYTDKYTKISADRPDESIIIKSISYMKDISLIKVHISGGARQYGIIHIITEYLSEEKINVLSLTTSNTTLAFLIQNKDANRVSTSLQSLNRTIKLIDTIESFSDLALICIVGKGLNNIAELSRVLRILSEIRVKIYTISAGASSMAYQFAVGKKDLEISINSIHKEFFKNVENQKNDGSSLMIQSIT